MPVIALVDIDAFFPQAEQLAHPEFRSRPVIVGGHLTDRGVVASASYEARAHGVRTAMPLRQAVRLCPTGVFLRGNFALYADLSRRMIDACRRHTPAVEPVSLDEAYLDLTGCRRHWRNDDGTLMAEALWPMAAACRLQQDILRETGLRVSIGVGANRLVAKVASDLAKPAGVLHVRPGYEAALLAPLPVRELPGIGPKTAERIARTPIRTVGQLAGLSREVFIDMFGPSGAALFDRANGRAPAEVTCTDRPPKSISRDTTLERDTCDQHALGVMLSYLLQRACRQLRKEGLVAGTVTLKLRYADFRTVSRSRTLPAHTDQDKHFYDVLMELLPRACTRRMAVRLVGVSLSGLTASRQMPLFSERDEAARRQFYASLDAIRDRFGFSAVMASRAIEMMGTHKRTQEGFELPTACLSR